MDRTAWCWLRQIIDCAVEPEMVGPDQPLRQLPDLFSAIRVYFPGCNLPPPGGPRLQRPAGPVRKGAYGSPATYPRRRQPVVCGHALRFGDLLYLGRLIFADLWSGVHHGVPLRAAGCAGDRRAERDTRLLAGRHCDGLAESDLRQADAVCRGVRALQRRYSRSSQPDQFYPGRVFPGGHLEGDGGEGGLEEKSADWTIDRRVWHDLHYRLARQPLRGAHCRGGDVAPWGDGGGGG